MGFEIQLQDCLRVRHDTVVDPKNVFDRLVTTSGNYPLLSSIDPYEDTLIDYSQLDHLIRELKAIMAKTEIDDERHLILNIIQMAEKNLRDPSLSLIFVGD